jgi:hypothetical protein
MTALPTVKQLEAKKPNEWMRNHGGDCPVLDDARVMVRYREGSICGPYPAKALRWRPRPGGLGRDFDIVAYKLEV